ncbi:enzymatic polyprotein [Labeo rohita]|uniref:Enzymatic polyprotein n=1 Tax=Labeo rohita TaxID=84645 RepID=A0ABQ8LVK9_LABRO|nr:enzymatic polyprotein [Labeo rohita]
MRGLLGSGARSVTSVPRGSGPASAEAERWLHSWGSQPDLLERMETGDPLSPSSPSRSAARSVGSEARSAVSFPRGMGSTLHLSSSEEVDVESVDEVSAPQSPQYEELLEVVTCAVAKLNIDWPAESQAEPQQSKLDERFLRSRPPSARRSLPFFPNLHTKVAKSYGNVVGMDEHGYRAMPRVEQTLASYLSPGSASSLKAPVLPSKPLRVTSALVGKGYTAAGQAGACLHTMSVLQAYQADLLKELDEGEEIKDNDIFEFRRTADLSLRATKEALVAAERHLWLTLSEMKEKDRVFLLDALLSPSGLFGDAVNSVVDRYQEARKQAAAFQRFLPRRHPAQGAAGREQRRPCTSSSHRETQKQSVASRTPPHRERAGRRSKLGTSKARPELREAVSLTLPVLQGAVVSSECSPQFPPPGNVVELGSSPPPRGSLGLLVQVLPAGRPLQDTVLAAQTTPEASPERLVPLVDHLAAWKLLPNVSAWVLHTVERGYRIQFGAPPPPFNGVSPTLVGPEQGLVMEQEVATLLRKEAIEVVPPHDRESGFYSRYFIVPKKDGGLRPILNLRLLNRSVMRLKFKMLTINQVVSQIRSEDWFVTIDLKDAYFHGIRILNYIDDWLILVQSEQSNEVKQIWRVFGQAQVDLFATQENAQCPRWFSLTHPAPLGLDSMVQTWPRLHLYAFPPIALLPGVLETVCRDGVALLLVAPFWPGRVWFSDLISLLEGSPWEIPVRRDLLSQAGGSFLHPRPELWKLWSSLYEETVCLEVEALHFLVRTVNCPVGTVLEFLQDRLSAGLTHSTLKVYVAAIAAYHAPLGGLSVGKNPLVTRFLRGALRLRPPGYINEVFEDLLQCCRIIYINDIHLLKATSPPHSFEATTSVNSVFRCIRDPYKLFMVKVDASSTSFLSSRESQLDYIHNNVCSVEGYIILLEEAISTREHPCHEGVYLSNGLLGGPWPFKVAKVPKPSAFSLATLPWIYRLSCPFSLDYCPVRPSFRLLSVCLEYPFALPPGLHSPSIDHHLFTGLLLCLACAISVRWGRCGERHLRDPCLKPTYKNDNGVGRRQPLTSLPAGKHALIPAPFIQLMGCACMSCVSSSRGNWMCSSRCIRKEER